MLIRLFAGCLLLLAAATALAQEWTRFRGPNGSGQSEATTIPATWEENGVLWKATLEGVGNSSPVLWGEKVFLLSASKDGTRHVLCISATDGKQLWRQDFAGKTQRLHAQNTLASCTPAVDADFVYCAWASSEELTLAALKHDGTTAWQTPLGPFQAMHGFATSPIVYGDLVILTDEQDGDSFIFGIDRRSGHVRWKVPRKVKEMQNASFAVPCIFQPQGKPAELIVASWSHGVSSLDPATGATNWEAEVLERRPVASPIILGDLILANCGEGGGNNSVVAVRPPTVAGGSLEAVYKLDKTTAPYVPSLVANGNLVFLWGDKGIVACIDGTTGEVHWRQRVGGNFFGSPVRVAGKVYCISAEGDVVTLAASKDYQLLGRSKLGEASRSTPAVASGRMFLRTENHLIAVGGK
jgi:outer membrane protein assembly factor BamB